MFLQLCNVLLAMISIDVSNTAIMMNTIYISTKAVSNIVQFDNKNIVDMYAIHLYFANQLSKVI